MGDACPSPTPLAGTWIPTELAWRSAWEPRAWRQGHRLGVLALGKVALGFCRQPLLLLVRRAVPILDHHGVFTVLELQSGEGFSGPGGEVPGQARAGGCAGNWANTVAPWAC